MMNVYEKIIYENAEKGFQYRLTLSEFRNVEYFHLRKYFLTYEGEWHPSKEGASFPATISNTFALLDGLIEICSKAEGVDAISEHLSDKLEELNG